MDMDLVQTNEAKNSKQQVLEIPMDDGVLVRLRVLGQSDATEAPRIVVGHGNGLATDGYAGFWSQLLSDYQVVLFDFRGHGRSESGSIENHSWPQFEQDFDAVMRAISQQLGQRKTYGAFHSLSSVISLRHARRFGPVLDGLLLFDPPIIPPDDHALQKAHIDEMMGLARRVEKRRAFFNSPDELAQQFQRSSMFSRLQPQACDELARALLRPVLKSDLPQGAEQAGTGGLPAQWRLSCPPQYEAKIFASNDDTSLWSWLSEVDQLGCPVKLVCADPDVVGVQPSAQINRMLAQEHGLDYVCVPNTTHFLQMENPDVCAIIAQGFCR